MRFWLVGVALFAVLGACVADIEMLEETSSQDIGPLSAEERAEAEARAMTERVRAADLATKEAAEQDQLRLNAAGAGCNCEHLLSVLVGLPRGSTLGFRDGSSPVNMTVGVSNATIDTSQNMNYRDVVAEQELKAKKEAQERTDAAEHEAAEAEKQHAEDMSRNYLQEQIVSHDDELTRAEGAYQHEKYLEHHRPGKPNSEPYPICAPGVVCANSTNNTLLGEGNATQAEDQDFVDPAAAERLKVDQSAAAEVDQGEQKLLEDLVKQQSNFTKTSQADIVAKLKACKCTQLVDGLKVNQLLEEVKAYHEVAQIPLPNI